MVGDTVGTNLYDPVIMGELRRRKRRDARRVSVGSAADGLAMRWQRTHEASLVMTPAIAASNNEEVQSTHPRRKFSDEDRWRRAEAWFYTTVFVEAKDEEDAEQKSIQLLRHDPKLQESTLNNKSDSPMMYVEEIEELQSFDGFKLPRLGFSFFPIENDEQEAGVS